MIASLLAIAALVLLNGAFVAVEFALVSVKDARLGEGRAADLVRRQRDKLDEYLSACQLGITVASLALGALGEPTIAHILEPRLESAVAAHTAATLGTIIALLIMTALHITAGEQAPKSFAIGSAERVAKLFAYPLHIFYLILRPLVILLNKVSNGMVRMFGGTPASGHAGAASLDELRHMIGSVAVSENLDRTDQQMLAGLFTLDERTVSDVMTPKHRISSLTPGQTINEALECTRDSGHSRFPLIEDDSDEVLGIVLVREMVNAMLDGNGDTPVASIKRDIIVAPRNQPLDVALERMQRERASLCAVLDEYGQLDGVISIEDIMEEIVGEIWDEDDLPETIEHDGNGTWLVAGDTSVVDLQSQDIDLVEEAGEYDSVGGLVQNHLEEIACVGDAVETGGYRLEVIEVDGHRIAKVCIEKLKEPTEAEAAAASA